MVDGNITVRTDKVIGRISPEIYGHFTEHIGGVIYDGVWVGEESDIPNINGIRKSLLDHIKRINPPVIRWPGGSFADGYHWRDGIGPRKGRPKRYGRWSDAIESNEFGLHEFIEFCRLCGSEPYLAANVGTGSAEEFHSWVEYCNAPPGQTTYADLRASNGSETPFNVKYWGVGNENWGSGGAFVPEDYCTEYRKFVTWVPRFSPLYLVGCGPLGNDTEWTRRFFSKFVDYKRVQIEGWSCHYYCGTTGHALEYTVDQWYEMLLKAEKMEELIRDQWATLQEFEPFREQWAALEQPGSPPEIKLVIDEWGCWHPGGTEVNKAHLFEQTSTLRDGLVAAITLDIFNRHCDKVSMANVAQLVNNLHSLFLADGPRFVATPNFYVFEMYKAHHGGDGMPIEIESPMVDWVMEGHVQRSPSLSGSASINGGKLHVSVVNRNVSNSVRVSIDLGGVEARGGEQVVLTAGDIHAHNTFDTPGEVVSVTSALAASGSRFVYEFAPASVTMLEVYV